MSKKNQYHFYKFSKEEVFSSIEKEKLLSALKSMMLIRSFELKAEGAYQQEKIGGFFHSYVGQEALQTACVAAIGKDNWYTTTYRCHALGLLLGVSPDSLMAELFGKVTGNVFGRGGSMHIFYDHLLGGLAIVGGHIPVATGAGFALKYKNIPQISVCFLGDGAVAQGVFSESLNLATLWNLPCLYIIENNHWGMGTAVEKAIALKPIAEKLAFAYGLKSYTLDGMDFFSCYAGLKRAYEEVLKDKKPIIVEAVLDRFKGHSISDPGLYRSKEEMQKVLKKDPILHMKKELLKKKILTKKQIEEMEEEQKKIVLEAIKFAEESPFPNPIELEEGVMKEKDL